MVESEITKYRPLALNDDFTINPTTYEITDEDLVLKYTSSKEVTRALAMIKEWKYAKSFTSNTITFANADFDIGTNNMSVVDVNYSDNTYGRFSSGITVIKKEAITPPPVIDNPPTIENINNLSGSTGETINITYIANDDNGITKHEFYDGSSWITKTPASIESNKYSISHIFENAGVKNCKIRVGDAKNQSVESNVFAITISDKIINSIEVLNSSYSFKDNEKVVINYKSSSSFSTAYLYGVGSVTNSESVNPTSITFPAITKGTYSAYIGTYVNNEWCTTSRFDLIITESVTPPVDNPPSVSQDIKNQSGILGDTFTLNYVATDDNELIKHEFYNGSSWATKTPNKNGDNYTITHTFRSSGVKECKVRVTDSNNQTSVSNIFTIEVNEPAINNPPNITINEATSNYNGEYSVKYTLSDAENDSMQISLKIDNGEYFIISEASKNGIHTYRGIGLKEGSHSLTLKVYDGFNYVEKSVSVIVPPKPIDPVNDYPILYDKTGTVKIGELKDIIDECYCEEERNGVFGIEFEYPNGYPFSDKLIEENIVEIKPNDEQGPQKFRIYETKKLMGNTISVFAWHESFDLANDNVENINLENASCEYALNTLFRSSHFSKDFRGYSDIINAQNYKVDNVNILNAIAGKEGSIIDTYGTGAEILRDGKNIHVLNKRGHDNGVTIEYGKNLTGFELSVDLAGLETRCGGFAKYRNESTNEDIIVKSDWIDSPFILNFAHPYINVEGRRDYSDKFKDGVIPTKEALNKLCSDEFKINKRDIPSNNYRIEFIPLSKCVGYEGIQDKISLCDTVTIIDPRFNINTKVKVIKYKYDFINQRYISMELGEPRTTLGDIIGGGNGTQGPPGKDGTNGKDGEPGKDGSIEDFPHTLPITPVLTAKVKGFASIDLSWTFEDKVYYTYELYASKTKDFNPNTFDLIHSGQSSSFLFQAKPAETWYFRVCAKNTHGDRTEFSSQVTVVTQKVDNFDEYFSSLGVGNLVANIFSADYMEAGIIKANWVELKGASVIDGNGKRTFDIDSFGRITLMPSVFKMMIDGKEEDVVTESKLLATKNELSYTITEIGSPNIVSNSDFEADGHNWFIHAGATIDYNANSYLGNQYGKMVGITSNYGGGLFQKIKTIPGEKYTVSFYALAQNLQPLVTNIGIEGINVISLENEPGFKRWTFKFVATKETHTFVAYAINPGTFFIGRIMINKGPLREYSSRQDEIYSKSVRLDGNGVTVESPNCRTKTNVDANGLTVIDTKDNTEVLSVKDGDMTAKGGHFKVTHPENGEIILWGRDVVINGGRALVGTGNVSELGTNKLFINYNNDFFKGVQIDGHVDIPKSLQVNGHAPMLDYGFSAQPFGYQIFSNGLIFQWGTFSGFGDGDTRIHFPTEFPNVCVHFNCTFEGDADTMFDVHGYNPSRIGANVVTKFMYGFNDRSRMVKWFAIGY